MQIHGTYIFMPILPYNHEKCMYPKAKIRQYDIPTIPPDICFLVVSAKIKSALKNYISLNNPLFFNIGLKIRYITEAKITAIIALTDVVSAPIFASAFDRSCGTPRIYVL